MYLYNIERLTQLPDWADISRKLSALNLRARPLREDDHNNGYIDLLSQLTHVGNVTDQDFRKRFEQMRSINQISDHYIVVVFEDTITKRIVASSTLFLEYKFIHECSMRGRLEDVAVLDTYRGRRIGELIVSVIVSLARNTYKCYKITLDCTEELKKFYARNDFHFASSMLCIRFSPTSE